MTRKIIFEEIEFEVDDKGRLLKMTNEGEAKDISIPSELPEGIRVNSLANGFCEGQYLTITIEDGISVEEAAFYNALINTVVWPSSQTTIPAKCFEESTISKILNIDNVEVVGDEAFSWCYALYEFTWPSKCKEIPESCFYEAPLKSIFNINHVESVASGAFMKTDLQTFRWPDKCTKIPYYCFAFSKLEEITNIGNVEKIGGSAFKNTHLKEFNWPPKCKTIPNACFQSSPLKSISGIENVENIWDCAFENTLIKEVVWPALCMAVPSKCFNCCDELKILDFSKAMSLRIENDALSGVSGAKIYYPYYMEERS